MHGMTDEQRAAIRAREREATPGPWKVGVGWQDEHTAGAETAAHWLPVNSASTDQENPHSPDRVALIRYFPGAFSFPHAEARADAEFIAHAREDIALLLEENEQLKRERDEAVAHDRQPYPTAWAYEQSCKALEEHRDRADKAEAELAKLRKVVEYSDIIADHLGGKHAPAVLPGPSVEGCDDCPLCRADVLRNEVVAYRAELVDVRQGVLPSGGGSELMLRQIADAMVAIRRVREFADDMASWCSPHGVSVMYANRLKAILPPVGKVHDAASFIEGFRVGLREDVATKRGRSDENACRECGFTNGRHHSIGCAGGDDPELAAVVARYPVGAAVRFWPIAGQSTVEVSRVRSEPWRLGHGTIVLMIEGRTGGVAVSHLAPADGEPVERWPLAVTCPACPAPEGRWCVGGEGAAIGFVHKARRVAAVKQAEAERKSGATS